MRHRLYRSTTNRMIAGICGGIAEHFDIDPVIVRLVAVALLIFTGLFPTFFVYLLLWVIVPERPEP